MSTPGEDVKLSRLEIEHTIAVLRRYRDKTVATRLELEERERAGVDGTIREAILAATNEVALLSGILAKLWYLLRRC